MVGLRGQTPAALHVPVSTIPGLACLSHPTGGNYGFSQFVTPCRDFLLNNLDQVRALATGSTAASPDDPLSYYSDVEKTQAAYLKARLGAQLGGIGIDGTFGVRVVHTKQDVSGFVSVDGVPTDTPFTEGGSSTDVLPSMALKFSLRPDLIARVVAGKSIQRANFSDYNPGLRLQIANGSTSQLNTGTAGNPALKPVQSRNVDVSLEWYFNRTGSLTGALFRHDFKDFLLYKGLTETHDGVDYLVTRPYNAQKAKLQGFEIGYRQFFDKLPGAFGGLGMEANYTHMQGGMTDVVTNETTDFPGMSKNAYNLVGLYEKGPWSARVAYNWRSKFVAERNYRGLGFDLMVDPIYWLDASISYKINDNLTLTLDGNNLLNFAYHDYHAVPEQPRDVRRYDRMVGLALRWKL
jgi:iron complex outermembrane recepter protein